VQASSRVDLSSLGPAPDASAAEPTLLESNVSAMQVMIATLGSRTATTATAAPPSSSTRSAKSKAATALCNSWQESPLGGENRVEEEPEDGGEGEEESEMDGPVRKESVKKNNKNKKAVVHMG
jgi:hypothetical protein